MQRVFFHFVSSFAWFSTFLGTNTDVLTDGSSFYITNEMAKSYIPIQKIHAFSLKSSFCSSENVKIFYHFTASYRPYFRPLAMLLAFARISCGVIRPFWGIEKNNLENFELSPDNKKILPCFIFITPDAVFPIPWIWKRLFGPFFRKNKRKLHKSEILCKQKLTPNDVSTRLVIEICWIHQHKTC